MVRIIIVRPLLPMPAKMIAHARVPWGRSLLLGILAIIGLAAGYPVWGLAQMGGPVPFTSLWLVIIVPLLLVAVFLAKVREISSAIVCSLLLSLPTAAFCWFISTASPQVEQYYKSEVRRDAILTVIVSAAVMICGSFMRRRRRSN